MKFSFGLLAAIKLKRTYMHSVCAYLNYCRKLSITFLTVAYLPACPSLNETEDIVYSEDDATALEAAQVQIGLR